MSTGRASRYPLIPLCPCGCGQTRETAIRNLINYQNCTREQAEHELDRVAARLNGEHTP
jgi:hypothetical protein